MRNLFLIMMLVGCKSIQPVGSIFDTAEKVKEVPNAIQDVSKTVNTVENISSNKRQGIFPLRFSGIGCACLWSSALERSRYGVVQEEIWESIIFS